MLRNSSKQSEHTQRLVVGIDAGSTYTDGVLLNYRSRQIVSTAKVPTTRPDLSLGIMRTIDALPIRDASQIALVCLSTTLATNSIVEGRNLPVALVLIGYDPVTLNMAPGNLAAQFKQNLFWRSESFHAVMSADSSP